MKTYLFTVYFESKVLAKRPYLRIEGLEGRYLRVITLEDKVTIHNAFPDREFVP